MTVTGTQQGTRRTPDSRWTKWAGWLAVPLLASLTVLLVWPDQREYLAEGIVAWCCLAVSRELLAEITARLRTTWRSPSAHDAVLRRITALRPPVEQARRADQIAIVSTTDRNTVEQALVPLLRDVTDERLRRRHGTDLASVSEAEARRLLGDAGYDLLWSRPPSPPGETTGLGAGTLQDVLDHLDAL